MNIIYDRTSAAFALERNLDPPMRKALEAELALLTASEHDLTEWTDILLVEPGDSEDDIGRETGVWPLIDPLSGVRFEQPSFEPGWDLLSLRDGVFRMVITYGSTFATILLVPDTEGVLTNLCRRYAGYTKD